MKWITTALCLGFMIQSCSKKSTSHSEAPKGLEANKDTKVVQSPNDADSEAIRVLKEKELGKQLKDILEDQNLAIGLSLMGDKLNQYVQLLIPSLRDQALMLEKSQEFIQGAQIELDQGLGLALAIRSSEVIKLLGFLEQWTQTQELNRLNAFKSILDIHKALSNHISPEGLSALVALQEWVIKVEMMREYSFLYGINGAKGEAIDLAKKFYVVNKEELSNLFDAYLQKTEALVRMQAPKKAGLVLKRLIAAIAEVEDPKTLDPSRRVALNTEIFELKKALKLPLDAVDESYFKALVQGEAKLEELKATQKSLSEALVGLKGFQKDRLESYGAFNGLLVELQNELMEIKSRALEVNPQALAMVKGGIQGIVIKLSLSTLVFEEIQKAYKKVPDDLKAKTFPKDSGINLVGLEKQLMANLGQVKLALQGLKAIVQAKNPCNLLGAPQAQGPLAVAKLNCSGAEIMVFIPSEASK